VQQQLLGRGGEQQQRGCGRRHDEPVHGGRSHGFHTRGRLQHLLQPQQGQVETQRQGGEQTKMYSLISGQGQTLHQLINEHLFKIVVESWYF
jgi:hypothetical protein